MRNSLMIAASALVLAACGGGSDDNGGAVEYCLAHFMRGNTSVDTSACNNCSVGAAGSSIDDDGSTYSQVTFGPSGGNITVRATAPVGTIFPASSTAGALMRFPAGSFENIGIRFLTYLNGAPVTTGGNGEFTQSGNISGNGSDTYYSFSSIGQFDAIEAVVSLSGNDTNTTVRLYEICAEK